MIIDSAPFPLKHGFTYNEDFDEFNKPHNDGIIIIWEKRGKWELSYTDGNDYQYFLGKGTEEDIERMLVVFTRDSKIDTILG